MNSFNNFIQVILNIIEKVGPTLATLLAVYLAFIYTKKQKLLENKTEEHKNLRVVISHLIQIWRELSRIEFYTSSKDFYAEVIFKDTKLATTYFDIDTKRIELFKKLLNESKDQIKSINVPLFYFLDRSFVEFNKSLSLFSSSGKVRRTDEKELKQMLDEIFKELVRDLEKIISDTSNYLPKTERVEILKIISDHHVELNQTNIDFEVPKFALDLINGFIPVVEPITEDEIAIFMNDSTIKMLIEKFFPHIIYIFMNDNPLQILRNVFGIIRNPQSIQEKISEDELLLKLDISEEENQLFQDNLGFYKLICAMYRKFDDKIPFAVRRELIKLNRGETNVKRELDLRKAKIILGQFTIENLG